MRRSFPITCLVATLSLGPGILPPAWPGSATADAQPAKAAQGGNMTTTPSGLQYEDIKVGTGAVAVKGKSVSVHYTGKLADGKKFDSSKDHGEAFVFRLGAGEVIRGWDEGVAGMKVGGKRNLVIPAALGYGSRSVGGVIPANSVLHFEVELLAVTD